jgi:hypothetical protein
MLVSRLKHASHAVFYFARIPRDISFNVAQALSLRSLVEKH